MILGYLRDPIQFLEMDGKEVPSLVVSLERCNAATSLRALEVLAELKKGKVADEELQVLERKVYSLLPYVIESNRKAGMMGEGVWRLVWIVFRVLRTEPNFYHSLPEEWLFPPDGLLHEEEVFYRLAAAHVHTLCRIYLSNEDLYPRVKSLLFVWLDANPVMDVKDTFDRIASTLHSTDYDFKRFHNTSSPTLRRYISALHAVHA